MKLVYSDPKTGRSTQIELTPDKAAPFLNAKIGDIIDASGLGLTGYKLKITGGSDKSGFPMDASIEGSVKTKGFRTLSESGREKGLRVRQTRRGNLVSADIEQINAVIVEYGDKPAAELFPPIKEKKKEAKTEEKAEAKPAKKA